MPKVDDVAWMSQRHGFLVRQDDQLIASFEFTSEAEAQAAQKKMQEILATCVEAMGYASPESARSTKAGYLSTNPEPI
jgi:hypothetical protein